MPRTVLGEDLRKIKAKRLQPMLHCVASMQPGDSSAQMAHRVPRSPYVEALTPNVTAFEGSTIIKVR